MVQIVRTDSQLCAVQGGYCGSQAHFNSGFLSALHSLVIFTQRNCLNYGVVQYEGSLSRGKPGPGLGSVRITTSHISPGDAAYKYGRIGQFSSAVIQTQTYCQTSFPHPQFLSQIPPEVRDVERRAVGQCLASLSYS